MPCWFVAWHGVRTAMAGSGTARCCRAPAEPRGWLRPIGRGRAGAGAATLLMSRRSPAGDGDVVGGVPGRNASAAVVRWSHACRASRKPGQDTSRGAGRACRAHGNSPRALRAFDEPIAGTCSVSHRRVPVRSWVNLLVNGHALLAYPYATASPARRKMQSSLEVNGAALGELAMLCCHHQPL